VRLHGGTVPPREMSRTDAETRAREAAFAPYVPRLAASWELEAPGERARELEGSLVSVDLSGFTALSERLAAKGKAGAEELILLISATFEGLIGVAERDGGDVLKFRGDALLLFFRGNGHERRACRAAAEMQRLIELAGPARSSVGDVRLRMSTGVYSGPCHFFLVGSTHRELIVTGPGASETVRLESAAEAGEIVVGPGTAAALDPAWLGEEREGARLLAGVPDESPPAPEPGDPVETAGLEQYVPAPLRAHLEVEAGEGEHRHAAVAFLGFSGTDALLAREGQGAVHAQLDLLGRVVCDVAEELGITWLESDVDTDGGKLYLTAGAPTSSGDDEERMLRAVRRILDAVHGLELRAGVNRGPVFAGDIGAATRRTYAVMGDTVNLAARLVARAGPGELFATADVLDRSRTLFETSHRPYLMKGKERPVTAYSLGAVAGVRAEEELDGGLPLVGREAELETLREALEAARMRQLRLVELVGEPGIGKSRLVHELQGAAAGFQQLVVRCERYESAQPFFAFRGILRTLAGIRPEQGPEEAGAQLAAWVGPAMPDLAPWLPLLAIPFDASVPSTPDADGLDPAFRRDRLHDVVDQFLTRVLLMPTLLVFEDAHWMDDASHFLVRHLAASPVPRPWLLCVTRRPEGEPVAGAGQGTSIELTPLAAEETERLALAAAADLPLAAQDLDALRERAGGNPLFVRELVAARREAGSLAELPETVETLITARMDTLDPGDRLLLRYASVVGPAFELPLLEEIVERERVRADDRERWERLSEFVCWEGVDALRFRHDLFRAVAYAGLSFRRRREIHHRLGEALERRVEDTAGETAGRLSLHFAEAGAYEKAWRYAVEAGRRAQRMYANVVAGELYERALGAAGQLPELPAAAVAEVWESLGDVSELFGRYEQAAEAHGRARSLAVEDPATQARLLRKEGLVHERTGDYDRALEAYDLGLQLIEDAAGDSGAAGAALEVAYAGVRFRQGRHDQAVRWAERAVEHGEAAGDRGVVAHARYLRGTALAIGLGRAEAVDDLERALGIYEQLGDFLGQGNVLNNLGIVRYYQGRWDDALEHWARSREAKERAGDVVNVAIQANNEGEILSDQGQLERARELFREALRVHRAAGYAIGVAVDLANLGRAAARSGDFEEARALLGEALGRFEEIGSEGFVLETRVRQAEAAMLAGEHRDAYEHATAAGSAAAETPVLATVAERVAGYAALQNRDPVTARRHLERSLELAREAGTPYEVGLTLQALAELARRGGGGEPVELEREARELLAGLGVVSTPRVPLP
jgi:class 3 adenylate cyclase/tetratricopeptide (TPR) repeat protein